MKKKSQSEGHKKVLNGTPSPYIIDDQRLAVMVLEKIYKHVAKNHLGYEIHI